MQTMCFGHRHDPPDPHANQPPPKALGSEPTLGPGGNSIYGRVADFPRRPTDFGWGTVIAEGWTRLQVECRILELHPGASLFLQPGRGRESVLVVEAGEAALEAAGHAGPIPLGALDSVRSGPDASGRIDARTSVRILETSMISTTMPAELRAQLEVKPRNDADWKLYEYEALGQEVFTPRHEGAIGLLRFMFPQDQIPVHVHPASGRIIRPISGSGYTYIHPDQCPMDNTTIAAFDANVIHTNGPLRGETYELWAVQLPWIASGIDTQNIAGHEQFVRYVGEVPVPAKYKSRDRLLQLAREQRSR